MKSRIANAAALMGIVLSLAGFSAAEEEQGKISLEGLETALHEQLEGEPSSDVVPAGFLRRHREERAAACPEPDFLLLDDDLPEACKHYATCPHCQHSPCSHCPDSHCYRGVDHLGSIYHELIGDGDHVRGVSHWPVQGVHGIAEGLDWYRDEICCSWHRTFDDTWLFMETRYLLSHGAPIKGALQCHFVNWRPDSIYLEGCIPEGYNLFPFAEGANHALFYPPNPCPPGPREPGGSEGEAIAVEGLDIVPVAALGVDIRPPEGDLPPDHARNSYAHLQDRFHCPGTQRDWCEKSFYWNASLLNHQPLYFEDVNLERHGFSHGKLQPLVSGAKFFGTLPTLPYQMCARPPQTTRYTLGESRPGSQAPYVHERLPVNLDAAAFQAAVITGLVFVIP